MLLRYILAIAGMVLVGFIVWKLLQWQERRHAAKSDEDNDRKR